MKKTEDYKERFKATFESEKLQRLINEWENDEIIEPETERKYSKDEMMELMRYEGRQTLEIIEDAKRLQQEIDEYNKKNGTNLQIADSLKRLIDGDGIFPTKGRSIDK